MEKLYVLCVYVPESHLKPLKKAIFKAEGGKIGDYDSCSWESKGVGQFRPLEGSRPFIGEQGMVEKVVEYKLEVVIREEKLSNVLAAMKEAHPYEEPAYHVLESVSPF